MESWESRFRAVRIGLPDWAEDAPDRCVYVSDATGVAELYAWDRVTDTHRRLTDRPNGTAYGTIDPAGEHVWWFDDTDGDELGVWRRQGFTDGAAEPAIPGLPPAYPAGLDIGRTLTVVGSATDDGCSIAVVRPGDPPVEIYRTDEDASAAGLSRDETLLAIEHSEHGDALHPDLRVVRVADGSTVGELSDRPGRGVESLDFSPVSGDQRLLVQHERRGRPELLVWEPVGGTVTEIDLPLDGELDADWFPDATALLVSAEHRGRATLHRYDLATGALTTIDTPPGVIGAATARPDGAIEFSWSDAATPPAIRVAGRTAPLLVPPGEPAPSSVPVTDAWVAGPGGPIHVLTAGTAPAAAPDTPPAAPPAAPPRATVFLVHGGPHWADQDSFSATRAAWVDLGYAVVHVNYRGSTGYGTAWRDAIIGRPGLTELADLAAVHDWAVGTGLADPARCVLAGASWGGYLTLLGLGVQPERWAAGVAGVPVADYAAAYDDEMEPLRAMDRTLFGGSPAEVPDAFAAASPITYVDQVRAPVLVLVGENDPRCPVRQIENYLARLSRRGAPYEVYRYSAGHGSLVTEEQIRQMRAELDFVRRHVPA